jgi:hypothetical protein
MVILIMTSPYFGAGKTSVFSPSGGKFRQFTIFLDENDFTL